MDSIIAEVTSSDFWAGVFLGQILFLGGLVYLIISVSPQRTSKVSSSEKNQPSQKR